MTSNHDNHTPMRHLSLFAGSGIGSLAAQAAGIVTVAHAENDTACCYSGCKSLGRA